MFFLFSPTILYPENLTMRNFYIILILLFDGCSEKSGNNRKEDPLVIKPPPNVDPYSDEWLAVFESAGEVTRVSFRCSYTPQ